MTSPKFHPSKRHRARMAVIQGLYMQLQTQLDSQTIIHEFYDYHLAKARQQNKIDTLDIPYFEWLMTQIPQHADSIDLLIKGCLSNNWHIERLSSVMHCVLRSAVCELLYAPKVPLAVIVNEYIEISRFFLNEDDVKFVHSVVDTVGKQVRSGSLDTSATDNTPSLKDFHD